LADNVPLIDKEFETASSGLLIHRNVGPVAQAGAILHFIDAIEHAESILRLTFTINLIRLASEHKRSRLDIT
jgi:hypothetical protein